jgi:hypothetical protein
VQIYYIINLLLKLLLVESKLRSLEDLSVTPSRLSRPGSNLGQETTTGHLVINGIFQRPSFLPCSQLALHVCALLSGLLSGGSLSLLDTNLNSVVGLVPRFERVSINEDNSSLHQGLGTDQLVVGGIVDDIQDTNLASANFGTPREVTRVETEGTEFQVASASADGADALFSDFGHGRRSAQFELALLAELGATASRLATLVLSLPCDTLQTKRNGDA